MKITGEYWIESDGNGTYADGDEGHDAIAIRHVLYKFGDKIVDVAESRGIDTSEISNYDGYDPTEIADLIDQIVGWATPQSRSLQAAGKANPSADSAALMQAIGANIDAYKILRGFGNAPLYVMMYENWIAVRSMNIELYGYDERKRKILLNGLEDIFNQEGNYEEDLSDLEFEIYDHKTNRASNLTFADIENPAPVLRPQQMPTNTAGDRRFQWATSDTTENLPKKHTDSAPKVAPYKWNAVAQKEKITGPGQELWRGTSESFKNWVQIPESVYTLLRR